MTERPSSEFWRTKAEEYRVLAETAGDAETQKAFCKLAQDCDALATRQESLADFQAPQ